MDQLDRIKLEFASRRPLYEEFVEWVIDYIRNGLDIRDLSYSMVEGRAKSIPSFAEKLRRPGKSYSDPLLEISDLAAARIVVQTDDMIDPVAEMIDRQFDVDQVRSIDNRIRPEGAAIGYRTVHKVARLKETLTRHDDL